MDRTALPLLPSLRRLVLPALLLALAAAPVSGSQQPSLQPGPVPMISGGAEAAARLQRIETGLEQLDPSDGGMLDAAAYVPGVGFDAYNFDNNATETGGALFIPPDPMGAAGPDRLIAVTNVGIECRNKAGGLLWRDALRDFFSFAPSTLGTFTFDPKIVYDEHAGRFVAVTLERTDVTLGAGADASRIHIAVSKTSTPATATNADWWYASINSKLTLPGPVELWADYPGLEVDEEVVYITMSFFNFGSYAPAYDQRLYIVQKGLVGGLYGGGAAAVAQYDPYTATGIGGFKTTTMPAQVHGAGGVGAGIGTYLLSYSGLTYGGPANPEALIVIRVNNPTGAVSFTGEFVNLLDIENVGGVYGFPNLPDAPQMGSAKLIEVNDRRALDAVWRGGFIYLTTTINPNGYDPVNSGQATAHVIRLDATGVVNSASPAGLIVLSAETDIGAEDIAAGNYTFFPAVAVNNSNDVKVGFSGSASTTYGSAYVTEINQGTFTPLGTATVRAGVDYYERTFSPGGTGRNRWGDYSGICWDPADGTTFWVYNEWAMTRGTPTNTPAPVVVEDGRWATAWLSCVQMASMDWGDAPDPAYPTLNASGGASHTIVAGIRLGNLVDAEPDGQPNPIATGDDLAGPDEDGFIGGAPLNPGMVDNYTVTTSVPGWLDVWIDFNVNGSWLDPGEQVHSGPVPGGLHNFNWLTPPAAVPGFSFVRFRFNTVGPLPPGGPAPDGEVEDYRIFINQPQTDFGDAPDGPYPTVLASNGARHTIQPGVNLGNQIDAEPDGFPSPLADGDDLNNVQDEDGVFWVTPLPTGGTAQVDVFASVAGWCDIWVDFDGNGSWLDPGDQIYSGGVNAGINNILFAVPLTGIPGLNAVARVRYNLNGPLPPDGPAPDGEVEDYVVVIDQGLDFGDAPDPPYPTLLGSGGAHHFLQAGIFLGGQVDAEFDGQPHPNALGDDINGGADEDGVLWISQLIPGQPATVHVQASVPGWLDLWIDANVNGAFDAVELLFSGPVPPGPSVLGFAVPGPSPAGATFARVRFNTAGPLPPVGPAPDGEVEDYEVRIEPLDFGDAPDPTYRTLFASGGAHHLIVAGAFLGLQVDPEADGQPSPIADGDDVAGAPDEDGVVWATPLTAGAGAQVDVVASAGGQLDAWIDFDANGVFDHPGELIYSGGVAAGLNNILFVVPPAAVPGVTFARVRYNVNGLVMLPTGYVSDGEVEDYQVVVDPPVDLDFGDAPDPTYPTLLASNGARHLVVPGIFLGNLIDPEADGLPSPLADGDDLTNLPDEDGVVWLTPLVPGQVGQIQVTASVNGWLDVWIDLDIDGVWQAVEQVVAGPIPAGPIITNVVIPGGATPGFTYARVRFNTAGPLPPLGQAPDGEVEDYRVRIDPPELDFGDAPDTYTTLLASNGPRHVINPGVFLGNLIDPEADGQPTAPADGDDVNAADDEDGVTFLNPIVVNMPFQIDVNASTNGWLDVWADWNQDGVFQHPGELIYSNNVAAGVNNINLGVPGGTPSGVTCFRYRYNLTGALTPSGFAPDGEVEDYRVLVVAQTGFPGDGGGLLGFGAAAPNPFSDRVTVGFGLAAEEMVVIQVYGMDGTLVRTLARASYGPGRYEAVWDGRNDRGQPVTSGVYFFRMQAGKTSQNQKVLFVR